MKQIMDKHIIGDSSVFSIEYTFIDTTHETELSMYIKNVNVLEFIREGSHYTTRWNIDELVMWIHDNLTNMKEYPFPFENEGVFASEKDSLAHEFDTDNDEEFDAYYDKLDEWNLRHRWHTASEGAILADVYFQLVGDFVEISWNNTDAEDDVTFISETGGARIPKDLFDNIISQFIKEYALHWFNSKRRKKK